MGEKQTPSLEETFKRPANQPLRILISGGGTGGHIYPALSVAHELKERYGATILYIGDNNGLETRLVPLAGFQLETIHAGRLLRFISKQTFIELARVPLGFVESHRIVRKFNPHAAFTSGGYVSVPAGVAARRLGVPLLIHQQDVLPNLANRLLRPFATQISVSFADSLSYFPKEKTDLVGNPVRDNIRALAGSDTRLCKKDLGFLPAFPLLVVTGGSQGARHVNETVVATLPYLLERFQILHISGTGTYEATRTGALEQIRHFPEHVQQRYRIEPYLDEKMPLALAAADAVISRAGAATLAELAVLGKPSILIPLPPGLGASPQESNAQVFAKQSAAFVILGKDLSVNTLNESVQRLFLSPDARLQMARAARTFAYPDAAQKLAATVASLANAYVEHQKYRSVMNAIRKATP
jgi:UDP-N-acetylglucosamine--N-acetylmuramyl-(pentapeptide) pyrophosphoryl-undecaprenol N-acetylglucosamine transferase